MNDEDKVRLDTIRKLVETTTHAERIKSLHSRDKGKVVHTVVVKVEKIA